MLPPNLVSYALTFSTIFLLFSDHLDIEIVDTLPSSRYITFSQGDIDLTINGSILTKPEAYRIIVQPTRELIKLTGQDPAGALYCIYTFLSLIDEHGRVPQLTIQDAPRYSYRGMEFDVARNFYPKEQVYKLLNLMAMYKLNKFHFHLSDDEGWRLQIPGIEELTTVKSNWKKYQRKACLYG